LEAKEGVSSLEEWNETRATHYSDDGFDTYNPFLEQVVSATAIIATIVPRLCGPISASSSMNGSRRQRHDGGQSVYRRQTV
jgi:hypothetical protein